MVEMVETLNISRDFSPYPAGRNRRDGRFSGELFREEYLWKALKQPDVRVKLFLDGVAGLPSSFWEEVFGGLVRKGYMSANAVRERIEITTTEDDLRPYIQLAYRFAMDADSALNSSGHH
jgi:hypothetical protein